MILRIPTAIALSGVLLAAACTDPRYQAGGEYERTRQGAIAGAVIGGVLGAAADGGDDLRQAAVGATVGAIAGGAIGSMLDRQAAELRGDLSGNVGVVNTGNELIVRMPQDLLFAVNSDVVRPDLQRDLRVVAQSLMRYPDTVVEVVGHTDFDGSAAYNQDLSERRARSVAGILIGAGVPSYRVVAYGRGEDQPIASNYTPEGKAQNRRVEIIIRPNR